MQRRADNPLARQFIQKGCKWEYIDPVAIGHGYTEAITSGPPSTLRVMLDLLIVHNGNVFQKPNVWFLVYEGCLLDAMISDEMLNTIPCLNKPEITLLDTRARPSNLSILLQQIEDYHNLSDHRIAMATSTSPAKPPVTVNSTQSFPAKNHDSINLPTATRSGHTESPRPPGEKSTVDPSQQQHATQPGPTSQSPPSEESQHTADHPLLRPFHGPLPFQPHERTSSFLCGLTRLIAQPIHFSSRFPLHCCITIGSSMRKGSSIPRLRVFWKTYARQ